MKPTPLATPQGGVLLCSLLPIDCAVFRRAEIVSFLSRPAVPSRSFLRGGGSDRFDRETLRQDGFLIANFPMW
jgi:hypothetical protein